VFHHRSRTEQSEAPYPQIKRIAGCCLSLKVKKKKRKRLNWNRAGKCSLFKLLCSLINSIFPQNRFPLESYFPVGTTILSFTKRIVHGINGLVSATKLGTIDNFVAATKT